MTLSTISPESSGRSAETVTTVLSLSLLTTYFVSDMKSFPGVSKILTENSFTVPAVLGVCLLTATTISSTLLAFFKAFNMCSIIGLPPTLSNGFYS